MAPAAGPAIELITAATTGSELRRLVRDEIRPEVRDIACEIGRWIARNDSAERGPTASCDVDLEPGLVALLEGWLLHLEMTGEFAGSLPAPPELIAHAGAAAWAGMQLDDLIGLWHGAFRVLEDRLLAVGTVGDGTQRGLRRAERSLLLSVISATTRAYMNEHQRISGSAVAARSRIVQRLLDGDSPDDLAALSLDYDFNRWHLGFAASGDDVDRALQRAATRLGSDLLTFRPPGAALYGWLAGRMPVSREQFGSVVRDTIQPDAWLTVGAAAGGLDGWRLTHREARSAARVACRRQQPITHCADVLLDAAILENPVLAASIATNFLVPLDRVKMGGRTARMTLAAYFGCDRSVSSTASALRVTRKTVERRLRQIEEALHRPLRGCLELEVALRLEDAIRREVPAAADASPGAA